MSILVSLLTALPSSAAMTAMKSTARGPPAPLAAGQGGGAQLVGGVAHRHQGEEHQGRGLEGVADGHGHGRPAHGGGVAPHRHQKGQAQLVPRVSRMVPMSREQNSPWAMAPRASTPYRLAKSQCFSF